MLICLKFLCTLFNLNRAMTWQSYIQNSIIMSSIIISLCYYLFQMLYFKGIAAGKLPYLQCADIIIYSLSTAMVFHAVSLVFIFSALSVNSFDTRFIYKCMYKCHIYCTRKLHIGYFWVFSSPEHEVWSVFVRCWCVVIFFALNDFLSKTARRFWK